MSRVRALVFTRTLHVSDFIFFFSPANLLGNITGHVDVTFLAKHPTTRVTL
jgi:hypothetical protein